MLLLGRMVLKRNYATLERQHAETDLNQVCVILQSQLDSLDLMARAYASWDGTYSYMRDRDPRYVQSNLSRQVLRRLGMHLYMLVDRRSHVVLAESYVGDNRATLPADIDQLLRAVRRRSQPGSAVVGLMTLTGGPAMVAIRPVLPTHEDRPSRGVLVIVRDLGPEQLSVLSRLSDLPISISGTVGESAEIAGTNMLNHSSISTILLDEDHLFASAMLNDLWRQPRIRLQIEHDRSIWNQGKQTIRALLIVLIVVGLLFAFINLSLMQHLVVRRVECLIRLTSDTETEAGLSARAKVCGSDELAKLGHRMNQMLERLQNSQEKLLAVQERLRFEATHDGLTGIWNRAAALQLLDQELARSSRDGSSVAAIMFDADHFKRINDHFGHSTGDRALQAIAAAITRNLRSFDVCCRYGGEEFLVIAPNCSLDQAAQLAQRIVCYLRGAPVSIPEHSFCVTLSAGITATAATCRGEDLIMVADRALYRAKEKGRDRVEIEVFPTDAPVRGTWFAPADFDRAV